MIPLLVVIVLLLIAVIALQVYALRRGVSLDLSPVQQAFASVEKTAERTERAVREEAAKARDESAAASRATREELNVSLKNVGDSLNTRLSAVAQNTDARLDRTRETVEQRLLAMQDDAGKRMDVVRADASVAGKALREEVNSTVKTFGDTLSAGVSESNRVQQAQLDGFSERLDKLTRSNAEKLDAMKLTIEQRLTTVQEDNGRRVDQMRTEITTNAKQVRDEVNASLKGFNDSVINGMTRLGDGHKLEMESFAKQMATMALSSETRMDTLKRVVEQRLEGIQQDNAKQLEQMRNTVDEKLQGTLDKRLGESFKQVSERLEQVHKGLGEMQTLAAGVGDLKKVLTNVKTRGTWGEVLLGNLLDQILTAEQYAANVSTKNAEDRVEYAIKLPGRGDDRADVVWLPIDAKFPKEDYERLIEAQENADPVAAEAAARNLERSVKGFAQLICDKYLNPPKTTDFGIMFLPTEGLYAEVVRRTGLTEHMQSRCRVIVAGPTTLAALLNSLQMGFKTLAIQQRSSEVWGVLGEVKTEFLKYAGVMDHVKKKLEAATKSVDEVGRRTRAIDRKLRNVQDLPAVTEAPTPLLLVDGKTA